MHTTGKTPQGKGWRKRREDEEQEEERGEKIRRAMVVEKGVGCERERQKKEKRKEETHRTVMRIP